VKKKYIVCKKRNPFVDGCTVMNTRYHIAVKYVKWFVMLKC